MKATTIKLEEPILIELYSIKPSQISLTAFVKDLLHKGVQRQKMQDAAHRYQDFLAANAEETEWLKHWETAPLSKPASSARLSMRKRRATK